MTTRIVSTGQADWSMTRDSESHRIYKIKYKVQGALTDGPANAIQTPGLPQYGDVWQIDGDIDVWAFCKYETTVRPMVTDQPNKFWELEFTFSTKPDKAWCLEDQIEDPLLKPPKVSGGTVKYTEEAVQDRFGNPLMTSSWEQIRGPQVEFDKNRGQVHIEMPVPALNLGFIMSFQDKVNAYPIWGMSPRCAKCSSVKWDRNYYGVCFPYYNWIFDFDLRTDTFDRYVLDEGTKVLNGHWDLPTGNWVLDNVGGLPPNPLNPQHFIRYQDRLGNVARVILDGQGLPAGVFVGTSSGTASYSCTGCAANTTPLTMSITQLTMNDFAGDYEDYGILADGTLTADPTDPCRFVYTSGVAGMAVYLSTDTLAKQGIMELIFSTSDGSIPSVTYKAFVNLSGSTFNCQGPFVATLIDGDPTGCPLHLTVVPAGIATGPPFSGPPGIRYIQRYDEADFSLLGVPLQF